MTSTIFKDVELKEDVSNNSKNNTKTKKAKKFKSKSKYKQTKQGLQYSFDLDSISLFKKINLIKSISREIFLGLAIPKILDMYYDFNQIENSPILNTSGKDKAYLERYFLLLITAVGWREDEFLYWLSFIKDSNGQGLDNHTSAIEPSSFPEALQYIKAVASLFATVMLEKVPTAKVLDPILANYAEKELTLGNYLYLSYYQTQKAKKEQKSEELDLEKALSNIG